MKMTVLTLRCGGPDHLAPDEIEVKNASDLERIKQKILPAVYLISEKDLSLLRGFPDTVVDRGLKHRAKGLAKVMIGYKKIPVINGNFASTHQVQRSVRTLLMHAMNENDRNIYFIGIAERIFDQLSNMAKEERDRGDNRKQIGKFDSRPLSGFSDILSWLSNELGMQSQIPRNLMERYVGISRDVMLVRQLIVLAARNENPVLILGDTGTGKEVVAREIHSNSNRKNQPFISINCSGIPTALFESELFGHVKGAFTGAIQNKQGLWRLADKGTLFLDEIADLHPESQAKILRTLEDGCIRAVGGGTEFKVNARIVAATNRDLFSMVQSGEFREDLYYRLRGFFIRTPSLRDNPENIPVLAQYLWINIMRIKHKPLPNEIIRKLAEYTWPGNVRELKMVLQNLYGLFGTQKLREDHLKAVFYMEGQASLPSGGEADALECLKHLNRAQELIKSIELELLNIKTKSQATDAIGVSFGLGMNELVTICREPSLFHSGSLFSVVWDLLKLLNQFHEQLQKGHIEIGMNLSKKLEKEFALVQGTIKKEIDKILEEL
ncbi:MAG TPA: sigma 54-interacting transcriptional regulator [Desulfobacteraceae bacterium]|nr:sigma 54-interacting transcriptional regulator [Desulfobacteraceae bacterium]HPJ67024.1 sigma 54-interacting transcriptional regulator [Desulfobacteraceae bacterium]HPQ27290.1 sigma 54-interacting transcriptional regulator [Desulfobacteraceae bacterium]